jgi:hypothetical protein
MTNPAVAARSTVTRSRFSGQLTRARTISPTLAKVIVAAVRDCSSVTPATSLTSRYELKVATAATVPAGIATASTLRTKPLGSGLVRLERKEEGLDAYRQAAHQGEMTG